MVQNLHRPERTPALNLRRQLSLTFAAGSVGLLVAAILTSTAGTAQAADAKIGLGTASKFAVLAGSTVTNTGATVIAKDVGLSPGSSVTGFPPGLILGAKHVSDGVAIQAKKDLTTAYNDAAGRPMKTDVTGTDLAGLTLTPGVYEASSSMGLTGDLTLNAQGNPAAVFIFKAGSTLITGPNSTVKFINGGSACNVFWQVGSSATLDTATRFIGTIMANTSATLNTGARLEGRVLARTGAVTLDTNVITMPTCATSPTGTPTDGGTDGTTGGTGGTTPTGTTPGTNPTNPLTDTETPGRGSTTPPHPTPSPRIPVIPKKHPETGQGGSQISSSAPLLVLAGLAGGGAILLAGLSLGRSEKRRR